MTKIIEVKIKTTDDGDLIITVVKAFSPEYGGGFQTFVQHAADWAAAMEIASSMVVPA